MKLDNSQCKTWLECPLKWKERYGNNLEPVNRSSDALMFGTRMHQLLEERHRTLASDDKQLKMATGFPPLEDMSLEAEAQLTLAAYEAYYPEEPFEVVGVEEYFEVPLKTRTCPVCVSGWWKQGEVPCGNCKGIGSLIDHIYCGEFDAIVRMKDSRRLWLLETKTEKRGGKGNLPESWQQRSQVSLYVWAATQVYEEEFEGVLLNVVTRQSPKGQERPSFRRDNLVRTKAQQLNAVKNLVWVADAIERCEATGFFPSNRNACVSDWGWRCDYLKIHQNEERLADELIQIYYQEATPYLSGL